MKKSSIKKIFQRSDKSPKTPTEEVWGELCTTKTPAQHSSPPPHLTPSTPQRSNLLTHGGSSAGSNSSRGSHEYTFDSQVSDGGGSSSVERMSSFSRFSSPNLSSTRNSLVSSSRRSSRNGTSSGASSVKRFPLEHYSSASAVDLDAPIEAYDGPVDLDESIHSASSGNSWDRQNDEDHGELGVVAEARAAIRDGQEEREEDRTRMTASPDTIPVVYEDGYDSDSWSGTNPHRHMPRLVGMVDDASYTTSSVAPNLGDYPLAKRFTNDETMDVPADDDSAVYSFKARSEEESIIAPMSTDEMDGMRDAPARADLRESGFIRHETDDSALDDEDYYRQDYFSMMTRSKRMMYEDQGNKEGEDDEETEIFPSLSERVLMSKGGHGIVKRFSSIELMAMTEPDLPEGASFCDKQEDEDDGGDYGDFYTDASFPVITNENVEGEDCTRRFDDENDSEIHVENKESYDIGIEETKSLSTQQDRLHHTPTVLSALMLPADNEFVDDSNEADIAFNQACHDPVQLESSVEAMDCNEDIIFLDIGNAVVEEINVVEVEEEFVDQVLANADEVVIKASESNCDENSTNEQLEAMPETDHGNFTTEEHKAALQTGLCNEGVAGEIIQVVAKESRTVEVGQEVTEQAESKVDHLLHENATNHFDEQMPKDEPNYQEDTIIEANSKEEHTENAKASHCENDVSRDNAEDDPCPISTLVRSNSYVDSSPRCFSSQTSSPRRHSLGSITIESQDCANSNRPPKTPHKEITDNLVVAGVMSLFMGGSRFAGKIRAKTPMKGQCTNSEDNVVDGSKLSTKEGSPGLWSIPSLASPLVTPFAQTASATATFDFEADHIATSPAITTSIQSQLHGDICNTTEAENEELVSDVAVFIQGDSQQLHSRSRSLSPAPKNRRTINVDKPHVVERSMSLPVKWNPFPVSSLQLSSFQSSNYTKIGSNDITDEKMEGNSDDITLQLTCPDEKNDIDFPRLPLIAMDGEFTPNAPLSPSNSKASVGSFSPGTTLDVQKIVRENQRLRIKRQQLCESLGSIAQQFAAHESASAEKIFSLEQKIRALVAEKEHCVAVDKSGNYDAETVHRLSAGVLTQEKMLEAKDRQISQLTLRLEVLRRTLHDKEEKYKQTKKAWEEERVKFHNHLTSPEKKSFLCLKQELFESRMEVTRLKEDLDNALSDIDALTVALESNNEALDRAIVELENLRKLKSEQNHCENVDVATISRAIMPPLYSSPSKANEHDLRKKKTSEMVELQKDLEHSLHALNELRELVVAHNHKDYCDLEVEIQLLHHEAEATSLENKIANQRIKLLSADVEAKTEEMMKLRQELQAMETVRHKNVSGEKQPSSSPDSDRRPKDIIKDFFLVSDLVKKIADLKQKLAEYEKSDRDNAEEFKESKDEGTDADVQSLPLSPSEQVGVSESSPSKRVQPESPLTARRLFQPLRRGWATAAPLMRNHAIDSPESRENSTKEKDLEIARLNETIKANTEVMEKLKRDIINIQSEKEEIEFDFTSKLDKLKEENLAFASQVAVLEKAFMEMNDKRVSDGDEATDDGSTELPLSPSSKLDYVDTLQEDVDLQSNHIYLQRSVVEMERTQSHQEDEIEHLKAELVKLRVTSQQEKDAALEQVREELAIVTAQRSALESQLIEINKSAGLLRNSLFDQASSSSNKKSHELTPGEPTSPSCGFDGVAGGDPILVAQVVMLENANRVLENSVNSLRSDMQQKLAPLLEKIAMLEEEKRIMEDEMNAKLECREMTIKNLENSLQQLTSTRSAGSTKKKKHPKINSPK